MKITKAKIILAIFVLVAILGGYFFVNKFWMLGNNNKVQTAEAAGFFPFYFGGTIVKYEPACSSDPITGVCTNCLGCTLPMATPGFAGVGNYVCNGFQEIMFAPFFTTGANFLCLPKGVMPVGPVPSPGDYIMGGGASNIMPLFVYTAKSYKTKLQTGERLDNREVDQLMEDVYNY